MFYCIPGHHTIIFAAFKTDKSKTRHLVFWREALTEMKFWFKKLLGLFLIQSIILFVFVLLFLLLETI